MGGWVGGWVGVRVPVLCACECARVRSFVCEPAGLRARA